MPASDQNKLSTTHRERRKRAGRTVKLLRNRAGYTQKELSEKLKLEYYTFISQVEHGRSRISPETYDNWADALTVDRRTFATYMTLMEFPEIITSMMQKDTPTEAQLLDELGLLYKIQ